MYFKVIPLIGYGLIHIGTEACTTLMRHLLMHVPLPVAACRQPMYVNADAAAVRTHPHL